MKKFTVESKMRITFELFNDKQIEEVKKIAEENNRTLFSVIAEIYGIANTDLIMYRGKIDISNPCRMSIGEEVVQEKNQFEKTLERFMGYIDELENRDMSNRFEIDMLKNLNAERRQTISDLQAENESLKDKLSRVLLSVDTVKEMNTMVTIDEHEKQAVKEFAAKLKTKIHNFYPSIDHYCISEKAVLVSDIDKLLKEFLEQ